MTTSTEAPATQAAWIIVSQVKSHRVVYFTDDADYQPATEGDWYYCSGYIGALPAGMTLRNCWGWRFNGGVFTDARERPAKPTHELLLDANRKALLRILREKIDAARAPFAPDCSEGEALRRHKLDEAQRYLAMSAGAGTDEGEATFPLLQSVGVARGISLLAAARLIVAKAQESDAVQHETERFREQLKHAIQTARSQAQLLELRVWLLEEVVPALSERFRYEVQNTEPVDIDQAISEVHRLHETARLKAQLREAINRQRAPLHSGYVGNDDIRKHKARLGQAVIAHGGTAPAGADLGPLQAYATARGISLQEAAQRLLASLAADAAVLARTEKTKDEWLARIDEMRSLRDIRQVSDGLAALQASDNQEAA